VSGRGEDVSCGNTGSQWPQGPEHSRAQFTPEVVFSCPKAWADYKAPSSPQSKKQQSILLGIMQEER
jgi:hypothetical protein